MHSCLHISQQGQKDSSSSRLEPTEAAVLPELVKNLTGCLREPIDTGAEQDEVEQEGSDSRGREQAATVWGEASQSQGAASELPPRPDA